MSRSTVQHFWNSLLEMFSCITSGNKYNPGTRAPTQLTASILEYSLPCFQGKSEEMVMCQWENCYEAFSHFVWW